MQAVQPARNQTQLAGCWKGLQGWGPGRVMQRVVQAIDPSLGDLEPAYRQYFLRTDIDQAILGMCFLLVPLAVLALADYPFAGLSLTFLALVVGRVGQLVFCAVTIAQLRRTTDYRAYDRLLAIWIIGGGVVSIAINLVRPPNFSQPTAMYALVVLAVYLVMPNQMIHRLLLALFFTSVTAALLLTGQRGLIVQYGTDSEMTNLIMSAVVLTNAMGVIVATRLSRLRRHQFVDRLDLERVRDELHIMATVDSLTGVLNRRRFLEIAEEELARSKRYGRPLSIVALDLDHFKTVNDRFGHAAGDDVLKELALSLQEHTRRQDVVGRLGGEEFAILLPETPVETAVTMAERVRTHLHFASVTTRDVALIVTASLGVAEITPIDHTVGDLLQRADQALYRAKNLGRDRVEVA